jgi:hypothetical protein
MKEKQLNELVHIFKRSLELQHATILNLIDYMEKPEDHGSLAECIENVKGIRGFLNALNENLSKLMADMDTPKKT